MAIIKHAPAGLIARATRPASFLSSKAGSGSATTLLQRREPRSAIHTPAKAVTEQFDLSNLRSQHLPQRSTRPISFVTSVVSQQRNASTTPAKEAIAAAANTPTGPSEKLTWNEFLRLRKIRRRFNLVASASLAAVSFVTGLGWLSEQNLEQLGSQLFGMDPLFVMGLSALGFAGAGWVVGPFIGSAIWRASYSSRVKGMAAVSLPAFADCLVSRRHRTLTSM